MIKNMIKAAARMLEGCNDPKVECAHTLLEELAKELEEKEPMKVKSSSQEGEYRVEVDDDKKLVKIHNLPLDANVEIDGVKMTHGEALGRKFTKAKIL